MEKQVKNVEALLSLIKENPELRIVPMVDSEIVADDGYSSWLGYFGKSEIDHIWITDERIYFKSIDQDDLVELEIAEINKVASVMHESHPLYESAEKQAEERVSAYNWEKVIAVWISAP